jgi:hypothetical protein
MKKAILYGLLICMAACKPSTEVTGAWKNLSISNPKPVTTIPVTALTSKTHVRQTVETDIAEALAKSGYRTVKSLDVMPPFTQGKTPDKEELFTKINNSGADVIMTLALIDKQTENRYIPGNAGYAPMPRFGYYGSFWGYYNNWYPALYSPGYYEESKTYFIETNLYDAGSEELLWSAQSETYNPGSLKKFSQEFAKVVVARMERDNVVTVKSRVRKEVVRITSGG